MTGGGRPARIAFFDAYALAAGAGIALRDLIERIDRDRFEPIALLPRAGPLVDLLREVGCPVEVIAPPPPLGVYGQGLTRAGAGTRLRIAVSLARYARTVAGWLRRNRVDLLHCNQTRAAFEAGPGGRLAGVPVVWNVRIRERLPRAVVRVAEACADRIITLTARDFAGLPDEGRLMRKSIVIRNAVDLERFSPGRDRNAARARLRVRPDAPVVLGVGVLVRRKGFDVAIRAVGALRERVPGLLMLIAGEDPAVGHGCRAELEALIGEVGLTGSVTLLGRRDDVPDLLAACDLLVLPSRCEGDPAAVLEAMAGGRPVVVSQAASAAVVDGVTGRVVAGADVGALSDAIESVLSDPAGAVRMGEAGRAVAEAEHDIRVMARRYEAAWADLIARRRYLARTFSARRRS